MIYAILLTLFITLCFLLILIILLQKGKSSAGVGGFGGGAQVLFGGSGGQDIFQKITWAMGALFMIGSLVIALMKSTQVGKAKYLEKVHMPRSTSPSIPMKTSSQEPLKEEPTESPSNSE